LKINIWYLLLFPPLLVNLHSFSFPMRRMYFSFISPLPFHPALNLPACVRHEQGLFTIDTWRAVHLKPCLVRQIKSSKEKCVSGVKPQSSHTSCDKLT
jgi:hypothetical protein